MEERRVWQKHIFGAARSAGITDREDLHALVSAACGKESLKEITKQDYLLIIKEITRRFSGHNKPRIPQTLPKTKAVSGMSQGQIKKVWQLMYELRKFDRVPSQSTLGGIIKREIKIDASAKEPFAWLSYKDGSVLIERLKKYVYNAEKRYLRGG